MAAIIRADPGFFDAEVALATIHAGADFGMTAKRNPALWRSVREVAPDASVRETDMESAEVAECSYCPAYWPEMTRAIVRPVRVKAEEIRADPRSGCRRSIDPDELKDVLAGRADHAYAYVVILTSLDWSAVEVEAWFRDRAEVKERLKDSKLGLSLCHLPSGYPEVNAVWMWSAFLALDISAVLLALAATQVLEEDGLAEQVALASSGTEDVSTEDVSTEDSGDEPTASTKPSTSAST